MLATDYVVLWKNNGPVHGEVYCLTVRLSRIVAVL